MAFSEQKSYVREVLRSVRLTGRAESYAEVDDLPDNFRFFSYNRAVQGNVKSLASHVVIEKAIEKFGKDYRVEDKAHPIRGLNDPKSVNADIARVKGAINGRTVEKPARRNCARAVFCRARPKRAAFAAKYPI